MATIPVGQSNNQTIPVIDNIQVPEVIQEPEYVQSFSKTIQAPQTNAVDSFTVKMDANDTPDYLDQKIDGISIVVVAGKLSIAQGTHTIDSHPDTTATGAQLNELISGGNTSLHTHDITGILVSSPSDSETDKTVNSNYIYDHVNDLDVNAVHLTESEKTSLLAIVPKPDGSYYVEDDGTNDGKILSATATPGVFAWISSSGISVDNGTYNYITLSGSTIILDQIDLSTDVKNKLSAENLPGDPGASPSTVFLNGNGSWTTINVTKLNSYPSIGTDSTKFLNNNGSWTTPNYLTIGTTADTAAAGNHTHDGLNKTIITLVKGVTVANKTTGLVEGTNYPTGWTIGAGDVVSNPLTSSAEDLVIKQAVDDIQRVSSIVVLDKQSEQYVELRDLSKFDRFGYNHSVVGEEDFQYIVLFGLTQNDLELRIVLDFE